MNKITFKVSSQKDYSVASLIKEINKISCRIYIDIENGFVVVENVNDTMIDNVIDLVDKYYTILSVEIDNIFEEAEIKQNQINVEGTVDVNASEEKVKRETAVLEPQSEDDLIIKKIEFENEVVEKRMNHLIRTAYWAMYNRRATEKDIDDYILTCMSEISMRYNSKPIIDFSVGDIVEVNYGSHLLGEIMGRHVSAIVCNVLNENMAYVVPITKVRDDITSQSYLLMDAPRDAIYENEIYKGGTVLVDKGRYLRTERFNSVIGKARPDFLKKLLYKMAFTFDFTDMLTEATGEEDELPFTMTDEVIEPMAGVSNDETSEDNIITVKSDEPITKMGEEEALFEVIGSLLEKLNKSKSVEEQVEKFLTEIGMPTTEKLVTQSFIIACDIKKIKYESIIKELSILNPNIKESIIKASLKETFKKWLEKYPLLAERCPKISLMSVLKVFAKRVRKD